MIDFAFLQKNIIFVLLALMSGSLLMWPYLRRIFIVSPEVNPSQAILMINREDALIVDIRADKNRAVGTLPNAKVIPIDELEKKLTNFNRYKNKPVILIGEGLQETQRAHTIFKKHEFQKVWTLKGGITAWLQANLPVQKVVFETNG